MNTEARPPQFVTEVAVEALGGAIAAIAMGWLGEVPALVGLVGGAVLASRIEPRAVAVLQRRREPPAALPIPSAAAASGTHTPPARAPRPAPRRPLGVRSSILITLTAVFAVLISVTLIELARGSSLIGDRETTFPTPKPPTVKVTVPRVNGLPRDEADRRLRALGFGVETQGSAFSPLERGLVLSTDPKGGEQADKSATVELVVSLGRGAFVPELRERLAEDGESELEARGFLVETRSRYDDDVALGGIIDTEPAGGQTVPFGSAVTIMVSSGPGADVPNLEQLPLEEARTELEALGFETDERNELNDVVQIGAVIRTEPEGGQTIARGARVTIVASSGPGTTVPTLVGKRVIEARADLDEHGLVLGGLSHAFSDVIPRGFVSGSKPEVGEVVAPGTAVELTVSRGPPQALPIEDVEQSSVSP